MKKPLFLAVALCVVAPLGAQTPWVGYSAAQIDQLVAPIALYPDPLLALMLPASTNAAQLPAAAQYVSGGGDPGQVDLQPWDPSIRGLAHYPSVLEWMAQNMPWTEALGEAFATQQTDVLRSIQQLRASARASGVLVDTPQQRVVMQGDQILILPAQDDALYVPEYDADIVYDAPVGFDGPYLAFGDAYAVGPWLDYACDWDDYSVWTTPWRPGWAYLRERRLEGNRWHVDPGHEVVRHTHDPREGPPQPHPRSFNAGNVSPSRGEARPEPSAGMHARPESPSTPAPAVRVPGAEESQAVQRGEPSRQEPAREQPAHASQPSRTEPSRSEPAHSQPSRSEPSRSEPSRSEPPRSDDSQGNRDRR